MAAVKKKIKYQQKYRILWEDDPTFSKWLCSSSKGLFYAYCKVCKVDLALGSGKTDLRKHGEGKKHKKNEASVKQIFCDTSKSSIEFDAKHILIADFNATENEQNMCIPKQSLLIESPKEFMEPQQSTSDNIDRLLDSVARTVRSDLENLIKKNKSILKSILQKPGMHDKEDSISWLTRVLVGHLSQHYLLEYTQEMCEINETSISMKLNSVEKLIEKSATEMRNLKAKLENTKEPSSSTADLSEFLVLKGTKLVN